MAEKLKRVQERQRYELIQGKGLDVNEFSLDTTPSGRPSVVHIGGSYFAFGLTSDGKHSADHEPGVDKTRDRVVTGTWERQVARFELWIDLRRDELETPDLWGQRDRVRDLVDSWSADNSAFTQEEQAEIALRLAALESKIEREFSLTQEQLDAVRDDLGYLREASTRAGRRDWLIMMIGTILSLGLQAVLPRASPTTSLALHGTPYQARSGRRLPSFRPAEVGARPRASSAARHLRDGPSRSRATCGSRSGSYRLPISPPSGGG